MPTAVWKGSLSFGLLRIPIRLYTAARSDRMYLHQIHKACNSRLRQPLFCPTCNRQVDRSEVIRGYEYEDGQYVLMGDDEIKRITPRSGKVMEIAAFVQEEQIDPIYFDASYFALPEKGSEKPYALLLKALQDTKRVGIATSRCTSASTLCLFVRENNGLTVHTMHFVNEIREVEGYGKMEKDMKLKPQEIKLAEQLWRACRKTSSRIDITTHFKRT